MSYHHLPTGGKPSCLASVFAAQIVASLLAMTFRYSPAISPRIRASFVSNIPPSESEGAGNAGRPERPIAACARVESEKHTRQSGHTGITRHSPRNGFTAYSALSPVTGFLATVAPEKLASQELDASIGASGPHDFAVRLTRHSSKAHPRPPHPASRL